MASNLIHYSSVSRAPAQAQSGTRDKTAAHISMHWITDAAIQANPETVRFRSQEKSRPNISHMPCSAFRPEMESSRV
jgi:hypothetical protein